MDERTSVGGRLKILPHVARLFALAPILAAGVWASLASKLPEPTADRQALGEVSMRFDWSEWNHFEGEPAHVVGRAVNTAMFEVPQVTFQIAALLNALLAAGVVVALAGLLRRTFALGVVGHAMALAVSGLLVCSPAFGADWLHVERTGLFLAPLLLLTGLLLLHCDGKLWWRSTLTLLFAAIAPFCHANGMFVFLALIPALLDASRRAGSRAAAWIVVCLVFGNVAAALSLCTVGTIALGGTGLVARLFDAPLATLQQVLAVTGAPWLDVVRLTSVDDMAFGALAWLAPLVLWRIGDRSDAARRAAAPWWGCIWFGLLIPLWLLERHGAAVAPSTIRELGFGAFLLPVGLVGVVAARFGTIVLPVAAGAAFVLGIQDWHCGLEPLRVAVMRVQATETNVLLPEVHPKERPDPVLPIAAAEWARLEQAGRVPTMLPPRAPLRIVTESPVVARLGAMLEGDTKEARGVARSSVFGDPVQCVLVIEQKEGQDPVVLGRTRPTWHATERETTWTVVLERAPTEGAIVGAYGWRPRRDQTVALGPKFTMRDGRLTPSP